MKALGKVRNAVIVLLIFLGWGGVSMAVERYEVDTVHSFARFKVWHLGIAYVLGGFPDISGTITADRQNPAASSVDIIIKTESVNTHVEKRDEHLRSEDFFHVAKYPVMRFKSTEVKKIDETHARVTGEFTLLGVTRPLTVTVELTGAGEDPWGGYRTGWKTEFEIKRSDYGMTKYIPLAGDVVQISLFLEAVRR